MHHSAWTRRDWLSRTTSSSAALLIGSRLGSLQSFSSIDPEIAAQARDEALPLDTSIPESLVTQAIDAARSAGAVYADARITRTVQQHFGFADGFLDDDRELLGFGVRALVNGYWGFAASPVWTTDEAARLGRAAVAQARVNAAGSARTVDMGRPPVVTGHWATPVKIDPFTVPIEEKIDHIQYWIRSAPQYKLSINTIPSYLHFVRQERVTATSDGSLVTQTIYESDGAIETFEAGGVAGLNVAAKGWELFLDAHVLDQYPGMPAIHSAKRAIERNSQPAVVGRYTIVCDGPTMAGIVDQTIALATQLDRALGYEANATGTSFLTDPLAMLGQLQVSSPAVTVTANRSAPGQLGTVKWDDEAIEPTKSMLITKGILTDFQTTREQATWLAPYYEPAGRPVRSSGYAAAENGLSITMQHTPNMALEPIAGSVSLDDLVANVANGILITNGGSTDGDFQVRRGLIRGDMRKITNGRLGRALVGGAVLYDTPDLWKKIIAVGGASTQGTIGISQYPYGGYFVKGQPPQSTSRSVTAAAAVIEAQALVDPNRKS